MPELKPCPFCGEKANLRQCGNGHSGNGEYIATFEAGCEKCKIKFTRESRFILENGYPKFSINGYEEVIRLWNTRNGKTGV